MTVVARSKPSSGKKQGSQKSIAPSRNTDVARARLRHAGPWRVSRRAIVMAAGIAAAIVVAGGLALQFLTGGWRHGAASATFVGSETCAGCHRAQAELWRASQHALAMQHATDTTMLGDFNDASFDHCGVHSP